MEKELTLKEIKADLREIRYYFSRLKEFKTAAKDIGISGITDKIERYNAVIRQAPPMLYDIYNGLYINNYSQDSLAIVMGYSREHINRLNRQILSFLQKKLKKEEDVL